MSRGGNVKDPSFLRVCRCGHLGRWHRGRCRINDCVCEEFAEQTIRYRRPAMDTVRLAKPGRNES